MKEQEDGIYYIKLWNKMIVHYDPDDKDKILRAYIITTGLLTKNNVTVKYKYTSEDYSTVEEALILFEFNDNDYKYSKIDFMLNGEEVGNVKKIIPIQKN